MSTCPAVITPVCEENKVTINSYQCPCCLSVLESDGSLGVQFGPEEDILYTKN